MYGERISCPISVNTEMYGEKKSCPISVATATKKHGIEKSGPISV